LKKDLYPKDIKNSYIQKIRILRYTTRFFLDGSSFEQRYPEEDRQPIKTLHIIGHQGNMDYNHRKYHCLPTRSAEITNTNNTSFGKEVKLVDM
jgi:hypothetical protein